MIDNNYKLFNSLQLGTLSSRRPYTDVLFLTDVFSGRKYSTILDIVGLLMSGRNFRDFGSFSVGCKRRISPSDGCTSAANGIGSDTDIYSGIWVSTNDLMISDTFTR